MATKYARNVTANWNVDSTWSTTGSGGAADSTVPTNADDVVFDASFTGSITLTASTTVNSVVCATGAAGTLTHNTGVNLIIDSQDGAGDSLKFVGTMTYTPAGTALINLTGAGTSKITTGGIVLNRITCNNAGDTFQLQDDLTISYSSTSTYCLGQGAGTWDTNGHSIIFTGESNYIDGVGELIVDNLVKSGTATKTNTIIVTINMDVTVTGTLNVDGNSAVNRVLITSSTLGTPITLTITGATISGCSNVDFRDITFANGGSNVDLSAITGGSGDCGGNTISGGGVLSFTTADDWYWNGSGTRNFSDYTYWYTATNGGGSQMAATLTPLPQDTCYFDADSIDGATTVDQDMPRVCKTLDFTGCAAMNFHTNNIDQTIFGSLIYVANITITSSTTGNWFFQGREGSFILSPENKYLTGWSSIIQSINATYILGSNLLKASNTEFEVSRGTFDADIYNLDAGTFTCDSGFPRTLLMGSGTWTGRLTNPWKFDSSGLTSTNVGETSTIVLAYNSTTNGVFDGGDCTYNNLSITAGGTGVREISSSNTFNVFTVNAPKTVKFTAGTIQTVNSFVVVNDAANVVNIDSTSAGTHYTLTDANGGTNENDYLSVTDCEGTPASTWYYGANGDADAYSLANGWAATSSVNVTVTPEALTSITSVNAPTIITPEILISLNTISLVSSIAGVPTERVGITQTLSTQTIISSVVSPSVLTSGSVTVSISSVLSLNVSQPILTIATVENVSVSISSPLSLISSVLSPSIQIGGSVNVSVSSLVLNSSLNISSVSTNIVLSMAPISLISSLVSLSIISGGNVLITPSSLSGVLSQTTSTEKTGISLSISVQSINISNLSNTINFACSISLSSISLITSILNNVISIATTILNTTQTINSTLLTPSKSIEAVFSSSINSITSSVFSISINTDSSIALNVLTEVLSVLSPSVHLLDVIITESNITLVFSVNSPTISVVNIPRGKISDIKIMDYVSQLIKVRNKNDQVIKIKDNTKQHLRIS